MSPSRARDKSGTPFPREPRQFAVKRTDRESGSRGAPGQRAVSALPSFSGGVPMKGAGSRLLPVCFSPTGPLPQAAPRLPTGYRGVRAHGPLSCLGRLLNNATAQGGLSSRPNVRLCLGFVSTAKMDSRNNVHFSSG